MILGDVGVGKEFLARRIHAHSYRKHRPFVKLNCAALPAPLTDSFGYCTTTPTDVRHPGFFAGCDGGTVLLHDVEDLDLTVQRHVLAVLERTESRPRVGTGPVPLNIRLIADTRRDICGAVRAGRFLAELYYRLNVLTIRVPPLRERRAEILPLAKAFIRKHTPASKIAPELPTRLQHSLTTYGWPGNIRELENTIHKFMTIQDPDPIVRSLCPAS
jgi:DNA-binding NtrC family response regulator